MNPWCWILVGREPRAVELEVWGRWFASADRHVRKTRFWGMYVSTVFLGLDYRWWGEEGDPPMLFETMVFYERDGLGEIYMDRYCTWWDAENGHDYAVLWAAGWRVLRWLRGCTSALRGMISGRTLSLNTLRWRKERELSKGVTFHSLMGSLKSSARVFERSKK